MLCRPCVAREPHARLGKEQPGCSVKRGTTDYNKRFFRVSSRGTRLEAGLARCPVNELSSDHLVSSCRPDAADYVHSKPPPQEFRHCRWREDSQGTAHERECRDAYLPGGSEIAITAYPPLHHQEGWNNSYRTLVEQIVPGETSHPANQASQRHVEPAQMPKTFQCRAPCVHLSPQ